MHRAEYFADFKWDEELEQLYLCIYANYKNEVTEVYNEYEDGKTRIRCIYPIMYAGYLFAPIGEKQHITYYQEWYEDGAWSEFEERYQINMFLKEENVNWNMPREFEKRNWFFVQKFMKLRCKNPFEFIRLIKKYKKHPSEVEALVERQQISLALSEMLWKLSKSKQKEVINFIKSNSMCENMKIKTILTALKNNLRYIEAEEFLYKKGNLKIDFHDYCYCRKNNILLTEYANHKQMLKEYGKALVIDYDNKYWKFPYDFHKIHQILIEKVGKYIKDLEVKERKKLNKKLEKISSNYPKANINNYDVYVPSNYEDIDLQANELQQCLISCNYYSKMANKKCVLIFIRKKGDAVATAEISMSKKIIQFYMNQAKEDSLPTPEVETVLNKYLDNIVIKSNKEVKYANN